MLAAFRDSVPNLLRRCGSYKDSKMIQLDTGIHPRSSLAQHLHRGIPLEKISRFLGWVTKSKHSIQLSNVVGHGSFSFNVWHKMFRWFSPDEAVRG